jgi:nucleoside-diphosphate-sugar epimerase
LGLATGGAGFIGAHFVEDLLAEGDSVVVLDEVRDAVAREAASGEAHEGSIQVERETGKGTTVRVSLPAKEAK